MQDFSAVICQNSLKRDSPLMITHPDRRNNMPHNLFRCNSAFPDITVFSMPVRTVFDMFRSRHAV